MLCHSNCHYQNGWHCFIQCCDNCGKIHDVVNMKRERVENLLELTKDLLTSKNVKWLERQKPKIEVEINRLENLLLEIK